ncbi:MAG: OmpA/MotB domain protein [Ilumatobacteraceae bacterium]|nr:OmpA/MotB domain protein [Ilumatobacteraceae bacterium]
MTRSRRGKGGHGGGGGGGGGHGGGDSRWLVTYADLLTLLMVLFLVLWVISTIDLKKFEQFKSGLGDFGNKAAAAAAPSDSTPNSTDSSTTTTEPETTTTVSGDPGTDPGGNGGTPPLDKTQLAGMVNQLNAAIDSSGLNGVVDVHVEERGLVVSIGTDNVLFDSGIGTLTPAGKLVLGSVAPELAKLSNNVIIEGYTDKRPLHRANYDNWDLSVDRAVSVLKVLRDDYGFDANRLAATGYGETHPIATGDDEASLAKNRRVELVIVAGPSADSSTSSTAPGATTPDATGTTTATASTTGITTTATATPATVTAGSTP